MRGSEQGGNGYSAEQERGRPSDPIDLGERLREVPLRLEHEPYSEQVPPEVLEEDHPVETGDPLDHCLLGKPGRHLEGVGSSGQPERARVDVGLHPLQKSGLDHLHHPIADRPRGDTEHPRQLSLGGLDPRPSGGDRLTLAKLPQDPNIEPVHVPIPLPRPGAPMRARGRNLSLGGLGGEPHPARGGPTPWVRPNLRR